MDFAELKLTIECARRKLGNVVFGKEFDSPHLHQHAISSSHLAGF